MAVKIIESCVNCFACEPVCPSNAIYEAKPHFLVNPKNAPNVKVIFRSFNVPVFAQLKEQFWIRLE